MRQIRLISLLESIGSFRGNSIKALAALAFGSSCVGIHGSLVVAQESTTIVPLSVLEARIPNAPGVLADQSAIDEAVEAVRAKRAEGGLQYTYSNAIGPAKLIVIGKQDNFVLRYEQIFGISLPLGGTKIRNQLAVLSAREREQLAIIAFNEIGRERLAQLRSAYVQYWSSLARVRVAETYLELSRDEQNQAEVLRRAGFTTASELRDFLNSVQKIRSESETLRSLARAQLTSIDAALGSEIAPFRPVAPLFFQNCIPERTQSIESAFRVDMMLAQYDASTNEVREQLARIRGATIDGSAKVGAGSVTDINHRVSGYSLKLGVDVSFPTHARDEERALRAQYAAELRTLALRQTQRRVEISASVDAILDDIDGTRIALKQTLADQGSREGDLRNAIIRFNMLRQTSDAGFNDVSARRGELYIAQRSVAEANSALLLKASDLLAVSPGACGAPYAPIPSWTPEPAKHGRDSAPAMVPIPTPSEHPSTRGSAAPTPVPSPGAPAAISTLFGT